jgi:hypothetical protein
MKKTAFLLLFMAQFSFIWAQNYSGPESVEFDSARNRYLVANTVSHQVIALQNGIKTIFATLTGSGPHGLEIVGDTLYCCNGGSIRALNLTNGTLVYSKSLGATFLNGITHDPSGNLFISDFSAKKIYRLNTLTRKFNVFVNSTVSTPNGIIYDPYDGITPRLVFCNWGSNASIKKINLSDSTVSILTNTTLSNCDGICKGKNGNFYVSTWGTQTIQGFDSTFLQTPVAVVTGLSNPADIVYNPLNDTLAVPNTSNNTVSFHYLGSPNSIYKTNLEENLNVYPNPTSGSITIDSPLLPIKRIIVYNQKMQEIDRPQITNSSKFIIDLQNLKSGIYFLQINESPILKSIVRN